MKLLRKTVTSLLNCRFATAIKLHNVLHGFQAGQGARTAALEAKLLQQLTSMREAVLHEIFMDVHRAYDVLYQDR